MKIYTSTMKYKGKDGLDVTVKGQDQLGKYFAPTWTMVTGLKEGLITWDRYVHEYSNLLYKRFIESPQYFKEVCGLGTVTFKCYCKSPDRCHRLILAKFFEALELVRYDVEYMGER